MSSKKPLHIEFENTIFGIVREILGKDAPDPETLRKPKRKGRRFTGLTHDQRELIKLAPGINVPPPFKAGLWFLAQFHLHRERSIFKGDFKAYVIAHLHEEFDAFGSSGETIAAIYGLDRETVAGLAEIYRSPRRCRFQGRLRTAFCDGTAQALIANHKRHCDLLDRYPALRRHG